MKAILSTKKEGHIVKNDGHIVWLTKNDGLIVKLAVNKKCYIYGTMY